MITIVIPTYNRAYIISRSLDSVQKQTFANWECIVVDDHQAYHQSGNSIVVPVLKEIILTLIPYLKENA